MSNKVSMRRRGKFYSVYNDDAYVLHGLLRYKIVKNRIGFPVEALGKVQEALEENRVDYVVIDNDKEVLRRKFSNNHYDKFFNKGKNITISLEMRRILLRGHIDRMWSFFIIIRRVGIRCLRKKWQFGMFWLLILDYSFEKVSS